MSEQSQNTARTSRLTWLTAAHVWAIFGLALSSLLLGLGVVGSVFTLLRTGNTGNRGKTGVGAQLRLLELWRLNRSLLLPMTVYLLAYGVSAATGVDPRRGMGEFLSTVFTTLGLLLLLLWMRGEQRTRWMLNGVLISIGIFALWGVAQYLFTDYGPVWNRIPGPFSHYMTFSGVLLIGVLALLPRMANDNGRYGIQNWVLLAIIGTAMVLTLTRHVWIATFVACSIVIWVVARRWTAVYLAALVAAGLTLSACAPDQWGRVRSIVDMDDASNYDRLCMTWAGARMIGDQPFFGLGPGSVESMYPLYRHPTAPRTEAKHLHNTFVQMAAERGLIEVGAFLWLMFVVGREGFRGYREQIKNGGTCADLYFTTFLAVVVFNVAGLFEANWRDTEVNRLMLFLMAIPWLLRKSELGGPEELHGSGGSDRTGDADIALPQGGDGISLQEPST